MTQLSRPSVDACAELLRALPALSALRRSLWSVASADAQRWLPALSVLCRHPDGLRLGQVADLLQVDASVASRQVAQLEESGLAVREVDPADGRAVLLRASLAGKQRLDAAVAHFAAHVSEHLDGWTDAEVGQLAAQLHRLSTCMEDKHT